MACADWSLYTGLYGGSLFEEEEAFARYLTRAQAYLEAVTLSRAARFRNASGEDGAQQEVRRALGLACCAVAEELRRAEEDSGVAGESVGRYQLSFRPPEGSAAWRLYRAALPYLSETGMLYRGL